MTITVTKEMGKKKLNQELKKKKPARVLDAKRHAGKVKWNEDALTWQKRVRREWD